ncbi:MAG: hypothetical protein IJE59_03125 [Clostridia bacterium]|nr:hypothetical protein [Clostridia bacterium]
MVKLLVGNGNSTKLDSLCRKLANDKNNYRVEKVNIGKDVITMYHKINPDILILDNSLLDMTIEDIVNRLSVNPRESKKCNIILILQKDYNLKIKNHSKINTVFYEPYSSNKLNNTIKELAIDYNTPDLEFGEVDWLLQSLDFNCMSGGYRYIVEAITYCYYRPEQLEFLNDVLIYLSFQFKTSKSQIRDAMNASIRPFNNSSNYTCSEELLKALFPNGHNCSLKDFLVKIVLHLIKEKKKGRLF